MISTRFIRSTGEKKWMPMKVSGSRLARASSLIGRVEVLVAKIASGARCCLGLRVVSALTSGSSNTASTTRSQPASAA